MQRALAGVAIAIVLVLLTTPLKLVVSTVVGRLRMDQQHRTARNRVEPLRLAAARMPDIGGGRVEWRKLLPVGDGIVAFGERDGAESIVLLSLDSSGNVRASTEIDHCIQGDAVAIGASEVVVLCATADRARFVGIEADGAHLNQRAVPGDGIPLHCSKGCVLVSAARGDRYFWLLPEGGGHRVIVTGRGMAEPDGTEVRGLSTFVTGMVPFGEEGEVAVTHTDKVTGLRLSLISSDGTIVRSISVADQREDFPGLARAQLVSDGREIAVIWTRHRTKTWPMDSIDTVLVLRRFGEGLQSMAGAEQLTDDSKVLPVRAYAFAKGAMIAWDQGARNTWGVGSFVAFDSVANISYAAPRRTPSGRLPISVAQTRNRTFILVPASSSIRPSFETVIVGS